MKIQNTLNFPERIFNCDESAFQICPKSNKVIGPRGEKNIYEIAKGSDKESVTVAITVSASGVLLPPFLLFAYSRLPGPLVSNIPDDWAVGKSEKGWMTGESFFEYVANVFYPWLVKNKITFPVILFIDGHKSHLTLHLSNFCEDHQIILLALFPNATHIIQPCDVSIFKPLKEHWKKTVHKWRLDSNIEILNKTNFPLMFREAIDGVKKEHIVNGFKRCGLFPWSPDAVDYSKCMKNRATKSEVTPKAMPVQQKKLTHFEYIETLIDPDIINMFKQCVKDEIWKGEEKWLELFNVWLKARKQYHLNNVTIDREEHISGTSSGASTSHQLLYKVDQTETVQDDVPEVIWSESKGKVKRKRNLEKTPSEVTSKEWKKFMTQKEKK